MIIQVLGTGCTKCKTLYELAKKAVQETGVDAAGGEGRGHPADHGLQDHYDAGPGHQRLGQGRRPGAERGGNQEADPCGQGRLTDG